MMPFWVPQVGFVSAAAWKKHQKSLLQPIGPSYSINWSFVPVQQVAVDQANEPSRFKNGVVNVVLCCFIGFQIPLFWLVQDSRDERYWKIIKGRKERGWYKRWFKVSCSMAEISRNSMKFLCFYLLTSSSPEQAALHRSPTHWLDVRRWRYQGATPTPGARQSWEMLIHKAKESLPCY